MNSTRCATSLTCRYTTTGSSGAMISAILRMCAARRALAFLLNFFFGFLAGGLFLPEDGFLPVFGTTGTAAGASASLSICSAERASVFCAACVFFFMVRTARFSRVRLPSAVFFSALGALLLSLCAAPLRRSAAPVVFVADTSQSGSSSGTATIL